MIFRNYLNENLFIPFSEMPTPETNRKRNLHIDYENEIEEYPNQKFIKLVNITLLKIDISYILIIFLFFFKV